MSKEYTYKHTSSGKVIYQSIEPNYVSKEDVDKKVLEKTGQDPRLTKHIIDCTIRVVDESKPKKFSHYNKNKRMP